MGLAALVLPVRKLRLLGEAPSTAGPHLLGVESRGKCLAVLGAWGELLSQGPCQGQKPALSDEKDPKYPAVFTENKHSRTSTQKCSQEPPGHGNQQETRGPAGLTLAPPSAGTPSGWQVEKISVGWSTKGSGCEESLKSVTVSSALANCVTGTLAYVASSAGEMEARDIRRVGSGSKAQGLCQVQTNQVQSPTAQNEPGGH